MSNKQNDELFDTLKEDLKDKCRVYMNKIFDLFAEDSEITNLEITHIASLFLIYFLERHVEALVSAMDENKIPNELSNFFNNSTLDLINLKKELEKLSFQYAKAAIYLKLKGLGE